MLNFTYISAISSYTVHSLNQFGCINTMTLTSKQIFLLHILGLSIMTSEVESSVFIVYPFQVGHTNPSKPTFSMRKWDYDDSKSRKVLDDTNLHLIYPVKEELVIMTPSPVEEYDEMPLEETTETATEYGDELEARNRTIKSLESDDPQRELEEQTTANVLDNYTPTEMLPSIEGVTSNAEEEIHKISDANTNTEDTIFADSKIDLSTEVITTEVPLRKSTSLVPNLASIYDTTGPLKLLRKRMFGHHEYVPIMRMNVNKTILTTKRPTNKFKRRNKNKVTVLELKDNKGLSKEMTEDKKRKTDRKTLYKRRYLTSWRNGKTEPSQSTDSEINS